ncbi:MAG: septal ring lytic transglycosylase RlpA family protein [Paludibacter sp.]|jgi:rare lipoprotein A|nr:septal ring lytic transglycosylase RlpA family protein [Paludibacter sp.]
MKLRLILFIILLPLFVFGQERGVASYYSHNLKGRKTSDGSRYHPDSLTCAHKTYPFGTLLYVRNPANDYEVIVKVTDRGPHTRNRLIDLSYAAADRLDIIRKGLATVEISKLEYMPQPFSLLPVPVAYLTVDEFKVWLPKLNILPSHKAKRNSIFNKY